MNLLFSLIAISSALITPEVLTSFIELEKNNPQRALLDYKKKAKHITNEFTLDALQYHRIAIRAAIDTKDINTFLDILNTIKHDEFTPVTEKKALQIINDIGIIYRINNQLDDAIAHFQCAMTKTENANYIAALKSNIAAAYRIQNQPALGYSLLNSIEYIVLDKEIRAGIYITTGNFALHLNKTEDAIKHYQKALTLFKSQNKLRDETRLKFSIMTAALMAKDLSTFKQYRQGIEVKLQQFHIEQTDFINFLDMAYTAIKLKDNTQLKTKEFAELLLRLFKNDDANENIRLLLQTMKLESLLTPEQQRQPKEPILEANLGAPWCEDLEQTKEVKRP